MVAEYSLSCRDHAEAAPLNTHPCISVPEGTLPPLPINEPRRLEGLRRYDILDTPEEAAYDRVTRLASRLVGAPISLISLLDKSGNGSSPVTA